MSSLCRGVPVQGLPAPIADSWLRSSAAGLTPFSAIQPTPMGAARGRLAVAAGPVLDRFEQDIADSGFGVVLADRSCRVIDLRFGRRSEMRWSADRIGLELGNRFTEEYTGTNALATAFETRQPIYVDGDQHYLECLRRFTCYGLPIFHPVTSRLEGVIDLMVDRIEASPLMRTTVHRLVDEIGERLLEVSSRREQLVLKAYLDAANATSDPIVVLGGGLSLTNAAARAELDAGDYAGLADLSARPAGAHNLVLQSGAVVTVRTAELPAGSGTVFIFAPDRRGAPVPRGRNARPDLRPRLADTVGRFRNRIAGGVLVVGEPGSGRSTVARELAADDSYSHRCGVLGDSIAELIAALRADDQVVVIDDAHMLSDRDVTELVPLVAARAKPVVVTMTGTVTDPAHAVLAACCKHRIAVPPLRERRDEFAALATGLFGRLSDGRSRLTMAAVQALREQPWPGNLRELESILLAALEKRPVGDVGPDDFPDEFRLWQYRSGLTPLEQAEVDTIVTTLRATGGNKAHTAARLGISRSTLYTRMRAYRIRS